MPHYHDLPVTGQLSPSIGTIHFIGIGGIGMSSIAEIYHRLGFKVQGSDMSDSYVTSHLRELGISVFIGQDGSSLSKDVALVVRSTAIKPSNLELQKAISLGIPVFHRSDMLAELMRGKLAVAVGGTHGKTTTTAIVGSILVAADTDPTIINGGMIHAYKSNARFGHGEYVVAEADESDGSFIRLPRTVAIITNIDPEHLDHYGSFERQLEAFKTFIADLPFYGFAVICKDHPQAATYLEMGIERRLISYGLHSDAEIVASNLRKFPGKTLFDITVKASVTGKELSWKDVCLGVPGQHNVENALAAIGVALGLGLSEQSVRDGLAQFQGVKRRFTKTGEYNGITIVDDYAHHPKEISTTLRMANDVLEQTKGHVVAVFQPHRYTRVHDLFQEFCTCFNHAKTVIVADIYSAGESPIDGISQDSLIEGIRKSGHPHVIRLDDSGKLTALVNEHAQSGDIVLCMGAGSISQWAYALPQQLANQS